MNGIHPFRGTLAVVTCLIVTSGICTSTRAQTFELPGYGIVNQFEVPAEVTPIWGMTFSESGDALYIMSQSASEVYTLPVNRDADGTIISLGAASVLFEFVAPTESFDTDCTFNDAGGPNGGWLGQTLEMMPDTGTLFMMAQDYWEFGLLTQQRPSDGTFRWFVLDGDAICLQWKVSLAFTPPTGPGGTKLLAVSHHGGSQTFNDVLIYTLSDNGDETYTPIPDGVFLDGHFVIGPFYSEQPPDDIEFIPSGPLAGDLVLSSWDDEGLWIVDVDQVTGLPVGGPMNPVMTQVVSDFTAGPTYMDFDPVTGNLVVVNWPWAGFPETVLYQISGFIPTPEQAIASLIEEMAALAEGGELNAGNLGALSSKLENVLDKIDRDNDTAAINQLGAFINQVEGLVAGGVVTSAEGQPLIDAAQSVIDQLTASKGGPAPERSAEEELPAETALLQNFPNPFNPSTSIPYELSESGYVRLGVFDLVGREVARLVDGYRDAGSYAVGWDATGLPSGMYLYRLDTGSGSTTNRLVLQK